MHISWVLYQSGTKSDTKGQVSITSLFFCNFSSSQEQKLTFHHFLEQLYHTILESFEFLNRWRQYLIKKDNFLTAFLHILLVLSWSETNNSISGFSVIASILIFKDLELPVLYSLSKILYKLKQKAKKTAIPIKLKIKIVLL